MKELKERPVAKEADLRTPTPPVQQGPCGVSHVVGPPKKSQTGLRQLAQLCLVCAADTASIPSRQCQYQRGQDMGILAGAARPAASQSSISEADGATRIQAGTPRHRMHHVSAVALQQSYSCPGSDEMRHRG
jgi:hypothetical protein